MLPLREILLCPELLTALRAGPATFLATYQADIGEYAEMIADVVDQSFTHVPCAVDSVWGSRLIVDAKLAQVVGTCAFKNFPQHGEVEIAYFCFPVFEGRGYATLMAALLVQVAQKSGCVERVIAHTLPERNASTRVLEKNGFERDGEGHDDDVGLVWRWQLAIQS